MWIYVDLCNLFGVVFWKFMPFMVIFPDLFANKSTSRAVNECKWFNPKKMEISHFIWAPVTTDQFFLVHLILKKNMMQFRTGKHHQAICDSFLWITRGFIPWMEKTARNSQSHRLRNGFRCHHLPPGLLENPPNVQMIFPHKKVPSSGIFRFRVWFLKKQVNVQANRHYSLWITVIHQY